MIKGRYSSRETRERSWSNHDRAVIVPFKSFQPVPDAADPLPLQVFGLDGLHTHSSGPVELGAR
jgi:hypothetical protein